MIYFLNNARLERPITPNPKGVLGAKSYVLDSSGIVLSSGKIAEFISPCVWVLHKIQLWLFWMYSVLLNNAKLQRPIAPKLRGVSGTQSSGLESSGIVLSSGEIAEFITPSV